MLHLFKKVYLEHDDNIDYNFDRIVISELNGVQNWSEIEKISGGRLISYGKNLNNLNNINSFNDLLNKVNEKTIETNKPVYIYADKDSYYKILSLWYKIILPNAITNDIISLVKLNFDYKNFLKISSYWNMVDKKKNNNILFDSEKLQSEYNNLNINRQEYQSFIDNNISSFSVEFLLASYLYDGSRKDSLKSLLIPLVKIEISKWLYNIRELFTYHLLNRNFLNKIGITETYNINNCLDVIKNNHPIVQTFYNNPNVFLLNNLDHSTYDVVLTTGSKSLINFENITNQHIENIKQFLVSLGVSEVEWSYLIDILPLLRNSEFTDQQLDSIIKHQSSQDSSFNTGTFYGTNFPTINTYFIQHIFNEFNSNNKQALAPYVL
jgi:hypothetical protein